MHSVVPRPDEDAVLVGHRVAEGEKETQGKLRLVRPVRPETVHTGGDAKEGESVHYHGFKVKKIKVLRLEKCCSYKGCRHLPKAMVRYLALVKAR